MSLLFGKVGAGGVVESWGSGKVNAGRSQRVTSNGCLRAAGAGR